jgi:hypothetical protein
VEANQEPKGGVLIINIQLDVDWEFIFEMGAFVLAICIVYFQYRDTFDRRRK